MIHELVDLQASFGKVKLTKILYLIDVENYSRRGKTLTGLDWHFLFYGPYTSQIEDILRGLEFDIPQEEVTTKEGYKAYTFRPSRYAYVDVDDTLSIGEKATVDNVIKRWGLEDLNSILDHVYFETEPMKQGTRGERLDFSIVKRRAVFEEKAVPTLPSKEVKEFVDKFRELKERRKPVLRPQIMPKPRYDEIYKAALAIIDSEEVYRVPSGQIALDKNSKLWLRDLGQN
jgi:uncharacterized protein YwgA